MKELRFALLVLLLAIPIPAIVFNQITFPLQMLASRLASVLLPIFGVPVLREGNIIELPMMSLEVAEACSGIRSLMSLFTLRSLLRILPGEDVCKASRSCPGQHSDRDRGQCGAHSRYRLVRSILGSRQGHGLLSRVFRLGNVPGVARLSIHRPSHHASVPGQKERQR